MKLKAALSILLVFTYLNLYSADKFMPKEGDTVVFSGDSITHQCMYTQYVGNFLYTRYHDKKLHLFNSGISGDKAIDLLDRFEEDLAFQKPQWVSILLGMNDGRYKAFEQENFDTYKKDMSTILDKLKGINAIPVILTPTMFDQQQYRIRSQDKNFTFNRLNAHPDYNAKLGMYAGFLRSTANDRDLNVVDFWGPMNDITADFRQKEKNFTLSPDSIHPDPNGQAIMAAMLAEYFAGERDALFYRFNAGNTNKLKLTITPKHLPWVLPATGEKGPAPYHYVDNPIPGMKAALEGKTFHKETLIITGLTSGRYDVLMNDNIVFKGITNIDLARGLELQLNEKSPTYQQSLAIAMLNNKRNSEGMRMYRNIQGRMKGARRKLAEKADELKAFREKIQPDLDKYLKIVDDYEKQIHELAKPKPFTLEIKPAMKEKK